MRRVDVLVRLRRCTDVATEKVLERGEKIEDLDQKTASLESQSHVRLVRLRMSVVARNTREALCLCAVSLCADFRI